MPSQQSALLCQYRYDPLDRLINNHTQPNIPTLQRFYCKSRLVTEIQGAMQHSILQHGDQLLAQQRREDDVFDNALLATDQQRSVLHTLDKNPKPQSIAYSPYGHRQPESGLSSLLGFAGERPDPTTGHYLLGNGYRAFNPVLMRFNSPDNLSPFGKGGFNPYAYCSGDPINKYDPTGNVGQLIKNGLLRWKDRAAKTIASRATEVLEVTQSRKINTRNGLTPDSYYSLIDGVDPEMAIFARDRLKMINGRAEYIFLNNYRYLKQSGKARSKNAKINSELNTPAYRTDRVVLIDYIGDFKGVNGLVYDEGKLINAMSGIYEPTLRIHDRPTAEGAREFWKKLVNTPVPYERELWAEAERIREMYFK